MAKLTVPILVDWEGIKDYMAKADIVEVTRCKDCKHHTAPWYCEAWNNSPGFPAVGGNGFCFLGERKDG